MSAHDHILAAHREEQIRRLRLRALLDDSTGPATGPHHASRKNEHRNDEGPQPPRSSTPSQASASAKLTVAQRRLLAFHRSRYPTATILATAGRDYAGTSAAQPSSDRRTQGGWGKVLRSMLPPDARTPPPWRRDVAEPMELRPPAQHQAKAHNASHRQPDAEPASEQWEESVNLLDRIKQLQTVITTRRLNAQQVHQRLRDIAGFSGAHDVTTTGAGAGGTSGSRVPEALRDGTAHLPPWGMFVGLDSSNSSGDSDSSNSSSDDDDDDDDEHYSGARGGSGSDRASPHHNLNPHKLYENHGMASGEGSKWDSGGYTEYVSQLRSLWQALYGEAAAAPRYARRMGALQLRATTLWSMARERAPGLEEKCEALRLRVDARKDHYNACERKAITANHTAAHFFGVSVAQDGDPRLRVLAPAASAEAKTQAAMLTALKVLRPGVLDSRSGPAWRRFADLALRERPPPAEPGDDLPPSIFTFFCYAVVGAAQLHASRVGEGLLLDDHLEPLACAVTGAVYSKLSEAVAAEADKSNRTHRPILLTVRQVYDVFLYDTCVAGDPEAILLDPDPVAAAKAAAARALKPGAATGAATSDGAGPSCAPAAGGSTGGSTSMERFGREYVSFVMDRLCGLPTTAIQLLLARWCQLVRLVAAGLQYADSKELRDAAIDVSLALACVEGERAQRQFEANETSRQLARHLQQEQQQHQAVAAAQAPPFAVEHFGNGSSTARQSEAAAAAMGSHLLGFWSSPTQDRPTSDVLTFKFLFDELFRTVGQPKGLAEEQPLLDYVSRVLRAAAQRGLIDAPPGADTVDCMLGVLRQGLHDFGLIDVTDLRNGELQRDAKARAFELLMEAPRSWTGPLGGGYDPMVEPLVRSFQSPAGLLTEQLEELAEGLRPGIRAAHPESWGRALRRLGGQEEGSGVEGSVAEEELAAKVGSAAADEVDDKELATCALHCLLALRGARVPLSRLRFGYCLAAGAVAVYLRAERPRGQADQNSAAWIFKTLVHVPALPYLPANDPWVRSMLEALPAPPPLPPPPPSTMDLPRDHADWQNHLMEQLLDTVKRAWWRPNLLALMTAAVEEREQKAAQVREQLVRQGRGQQGRQERQVALEEDGPTGLRLYLLTLLGVGEEGLDDEEGPSDSDESVD